MIYALKLKSGGTMATQANVVLSWTLSTTSGVTSQTLMIASGSGSGTGVITGVTLSPLASGYSIMLPANTPIVATLTSNIVNGGVSLTSPPVILSFNTGPVNPPNSPSNFNYQVVGIS